LDLDVSSLPSPDDRANWPALRQILAERFRSRTRDQWVAHFAETDACVTPVLAIAESMENPHLVARATFTAKDGIRQPAPAPRLSRTPGAIRTGPPPPGAHSVEILSELGLGRRRINDLIRRGAVADGAT
jgi:alpha-methylacyl-CoA racemase